MGYLLLFELLVPLSETLQVPVEITALTEVALLRYVYALARSLFLLHKQLDLFQELHKLGILIEFSNRWREISLDLFLALR